MTRAEFRRFLKTHGFIKEHDSTCWRYRKGRVVYKMYISYVTKVRWLDLEGKNFRVEWTRLYSELLIKMPSQENKFNRQKPQLYHREATY